MLSIDVIGYRRTEAVTALEASLKVVLDTKAEAVREGLTEEITAVRELVLAVEKANAQGLAELKVGIEERIESLGQDLLSRINNITGHVESESNANEGTKEQIHNLFSRIDDINEKLYEFEVNKKNNLIFYGIQGEHRETPAELMDKVRVVTKQ